MLNRNNGLQVDVSAGTFGARLKATADTEAPAPVAYETIPSTGKKTGFRCTKEGLDTVTGWVEKYYGKNRYEGHRLERGLCTTNPQSNAACL